MIGSSGNDIWQGGWGSDTIIGGAGDDAISMVGDIFAAVISLPKREELWMQGVDPETLTRNRLRGMGIPASAPAV